MSRPGTPPRTTAADVMELAAEGGWPYLGQRVWKVYARALERLPAGDPALERLAAALVERQLGPAHPPELAEPAPPTEAELLELVEAAEDEMRGRALGWPS